MDSNAPPVKKRPFRVFFFILVAIIVLLAGAGLALHGLREMRGHSHKRGAPADTPVGAAIIEVAQPAVNAMTAEGLSELMDRNVRGAVVMARRNVVLEEACKNKDLINTSFFNSSPGDAPNRLAKIAAIEAVPGTNYISVTIKGQNALDTAEIANALAAAIVREARNEFQERCREQSKHLDDELTNLGRRIDQSRREAGALMSDATVTSLDSRRKSLDITMAALVPEMTHLTIAQAAADEALRLIQKQAETAGLLESTSEVEQAIEADGTLRTLGLAEASWSSELDDARQRFGPTHLSVAKLQARLDSVRQQIADRRKELTGLRVKSAVQSREDQLNAITAQLVKVRSEYQSAENIARDLQTRLTKLDQLQSVIRPLEEQTAKLIAQKTDLTLQIYQNPPLRLRSAARIDVK